MHFAVTNLYIQFIHSSMPTDSSSNEESTLDELKTGLREKITLATRIGVIFFFSSIVFLILSELTSVIPRMVGFSLLALAGISIFIATFISGMDKFYKTAYGEPYKNNEE